MAGSAPQKRTLSSKCITRRQESQAHAAAQAGAVAAAQVFNTAELLENILVRLPLCQIFQVQRVCHQFQDSVNTSIEIQKKLFIRTSTCTETWKHRALQWTHHRKLSFIRTTDAADVLTHYDVWTGLTNFQIATDRNPLFYSVGNTLTYDSEEGCVSKLQAGPEFRFLLSQTLQGHPVPSKLMKMQLTNPPTIRVEVDVQWRLNKTHPSMLVQSHNLNGTTVGAVLEAIRDTVPYRTFGRYVKKRKIPTATAGQMVKSHPSNGSLQIYTVVITLRGMLLSSARNRQECLPLPAVVDKSDDKKS